MNGRLRIGMNFESMKEKRRIFKIALNDCKVYVVRESSLSIQEKYKNKDMKSFWVEVQQKNNKVKLSEVIDGKNKASDIIGIFIEKFLNFDIDENRQEEINLINELKVSWENGRKFYPRVSVE